MRPLCCGMRSRPYRIVVPFARSSLNAVARLHLNILPAGCLSFLLYPNFYLDLWWARLGLFRGNAAYLNLQTARTAAGTPCRENALPPPRPRMLSSLRVYVRLRRPYYGSMPLSPGRSVSCTGYPPCEPSQTSLEVGGHLCRRQRQSPQLPAF